MLSCAALAGCGGTGGLGTGQNGDLSGFGGFDSTFGSRSASAGSPITSSFWQVAQLRTPPKIELSAQSTEKTPNGEVTCQEIFYDSPGPSGRPLRIFAYFAYPASNVGAKLPGIIIVHGGTGRADRTAAVEWASRGYAALSMDLPGKGPRREGSRSEGPDMQDDLIFKMTPSPTDSFLYSAVNSVVRAVSVMASSNQVDPNRIGVVGSSWGGVITLVANGIDNRISAACTIYGAGYITEESCWLAHGNMKHLTPKQVQSWREYFDPSSYLTTQSGKTLFVAATQDGYYPLRPFLKTYQNAKCEKALCLAPNMSHALNDSCKANVVKWFDWALRSGSELPKLKLATAAGKLKVTATGARPVTEVSIFTADGTDYEKATWKQTPLEAKDGAWTADAPEPTTPYYLTARDDTGATIAAEVHLPGMGRK